MMMTEYADVNPDITGVEMKSIKNPVPTERNTTLIAFVYHSFKYMCVYIYRYVYVHYTCMSRGNRIRCKQFW